MEQPKFSIVLITRNEALTLPRLLASLEEFKSRGGEIIVCDTGSQDSTVQIARDFGCKVEEAGERFLHKIDKELAEKINERFLVDEEPIVKEGDKYFDFASARNYCSSLAKNDWVCTVDSDEVLTVLDIDKINDVISDSKLAHLSYEFIFSHDQYGNPAIQFEQSKFFHRDKIIWKNIVHEIISPINGGGEARHIGHDVFKLEHWQQPGDRHSYLIGLAVDCFNHPESDRNSHYFSRELMWSGRPKSAIKELERHIQMNGWIQEKAESMCYLGDCYGKINQPEKQAEWYSKAFHLDSSRRTPLIRLAQFYRHNQNWQAAVSYAKAAMEIPWSPFYANDKAQYEHLPHEILYQALGWLGRIPEAQEHLLKALEFQPLNPQYLSDTKYYFEYGAPNIEGYMKYDELLWLFEQSKSLRTICEVGSFKGRSTHALLTGGSKITSVDHFKGSQDDKDGTHGAMGVYEQFKANVGHFENLEVKRMSSFEASQVSSDFDMVFIDAGHTYQEVVDDIRNWKSHATMILAGHDYSDKWPEVMQAVKDELGEVQVCDSIWYKLLAPTVSFVIPTLGREEGLKRCLDSIEKLKYPQELIDIHVLDGEGTVPQKVSKGVKDSHGELIVYGSNDTEFTPDSLALAVRECQKGFGLVAFNTGEVYEDEGNICEHFLIKRAIINDIGGEVFDTDFHHVGVDNLLWARCRGQATRCDKAVVKHYHFTQGSEIDDVYKKGWSHVDEDRELLKLKLEELDSKENNYNLAWTLDADMDRRVREDAWPEGLWS